MVPKVQFPIRAVSVQRKQRGTHAASSEKNLKRSLCGVQSKLADQLVGSTDAVNGVSRAKVLRHSDDIFYLTSLFLEKL